MLIYLVIPRLIRRGGLLFPFRLVFTIFTIFVVVVVIVIAVNVARDAREVLSASRASSCAVCPSAPAPAKFAVGYPAATRATRATNVSFAACSAAWFLALFFWRRAAFSPSDSTPHCLRLPWSAPRVPLPPICCAPRSRPAVRNGGLLAMDLYSATQWFYITRTIVNNFRNRNDWFPTGF